MNIIILFLQQIERKEGRKEGRKVVQCACWAIGSVDDVGSRSWPQINKCRSFGYRTN